MGCAFFAWHPSQFVLVGSNSRSSHHDVSNSFLSDLRSLVWALNGTKTLVKEIHIVLWTVSQSVCKRLTKKYVKPKKMRDKRVCTLMAWPWSNLSSLHLMVYIVLKLYNEIVDCMSCWGVNRIHPIFVSLNSEEVYAISTKS